MSVHDRLFRFVMRALPAEFRGDYGREMESQFRAERADAGGMLALTRLWLATIADVLRTAPAEHLDILGRDLGYAARLLARRPALTIAITLTLAIGIGANTAIFSVVNGVLLAPLPYPDSDRVVTIQESQATDGAGRTGYYSFDALRTQQQSFASVAAMASWSVVLRGDGQQPERVNGVRVSWEYFRTLGIAPALGRDFAAADDTPDTRRMLLLSDTLWRRRFNADPSIVGKVISIGGADFVVLGVMPRAMNELVSARLVPASEMWTLLGYTPALPQACRSCRHIQLIGRMKPGVAVAEAAADATRVYQSLTRQFPADYNASVALVTPVRDRFLGPVRPVLWMLWAAVSVLLVIACANVANLLLIRASEREEEVAIRRALGVSPTRLLRQLLTESLVLSVAGGAIGTVLASWVTHALVIYGPDDIPRLHEVTTSVPVLVYAIGASIVTGMIFGMAPARMLLSRVAGSSVLTHATRATAGPAAWRHRAWLIGANVALSTVLLVSSGLLLHSFITLLRVDPGFAPKGVLTMEVQLSGTRFADSFTYNTAAQRTTAAQRIAEFYDQLAARVGALPGVAAVGLTTSLPLTGTIDRWSITVEGQPNEHPEAAHEADRYGVASNYFAAMGIPLVRGRLLNDTDGAGAPPVVVIGQTMAEKFWPGEDPIGRRVKLAGGPNNPFRTIVGIVGDVHHGGLDEPVSFQAYMPQVQAPWSQAEMTLVIKASPGIDPLTLVAPARQQLRDLDPQQPITRLQTYDTILATQLAARRFTLVLLGSFAVTALLLAIVGLYGALSYVVAQRQREIGVRIALGAAAQDIRRLILAQGMRPVLIGILSGVLMAGAASQLISRMLFGVTPTDALTYSVTLTTMIACGSIACLLPARRASRVQPALALRT